MRRILIAFLFFGITPCIAQTDTEKKPVTSQPRFAIGPRFGGGLSMDRGETFGPVVLPPMIIGHAGFAARYMMGKEQHFAVELSGHYSISERTFTGFYDQPGSNYTSFGFRRQAWDAVLQGQYHFGKAKQSFRPYIGLGLGVNDVWHTTPNVDEAPYVQWLNPGVIGGPGFATVVQFEQGFNHRIDEDWSVMQSVVYRLDDYGRSTTSIRLGAFYSF